MTEAETGGLLDEELVCAGQENDESPWGPWIEIERSGLLGREFVCVGKVCSEELDESPLKGGSGPLGCLTEVEAVPLLDGRPVCVAVFVLTSDDDPVKDIPLSPPPGPLFAPTSTNVVTTVTVCEHEPDIDINCWPWVEVTVAVQGVTAGGEFDGVPLEEVVSELVLSFLGGEVGAAAKFELPGEVPKLVDFGSGLEKDDLTGFDEELEIVVVVLDDWTVTTV